MRFLIPAIGVVGILFCGAASAVAADYLVEFRPVLSEGEAAGTPHTVIESDGEEVPVHALPYLADRDIETVEIFRSLNNPDRLLVGFTFNENGLRRFRHLLRNFREKRVAVYSDGALIAVSQVLPPEFTSERIVIAWPGSEGELCAFAAAVNRKPPDIITLYIEEQIRYQDTAADTWADLYGRVARYMTSRSQQVANARNMVEASHE